MPTNNMSRLKLLSLFQSTTPFIPFHSPSNQQSLHFPFSQPFSLPPSFQSTFLSLPFLSVNYPSLSFQLTTLSFSFQPTFLSFPFPLPPFHWTPLFPPFTSINSSPFPFRVVSPFLFSLQSSISLTSFPSADSPPFSQLPQLLPSCYPPPPVLFLLS